MDLLNALRQLEGWHHVRDLDGKEVFLYRCKPNDTFWESDFGEKLFEGLYTLTQLGFAREASEVLRKDVENHIRNGEFLYIVCAQKEIFSYAILDLLETPIGKILYLSGIIIHPSIQGNGLGNRFIKCMISQHGPKFLTLRTQSPIMYESFLKACGNVYPCHSRYRENLSAIEAGIFTARVHLKMSLYDPSLGTEEGTYGSCLYGTEPCSKNYSIEHWFKTRVNLARGDSVILSGIPCCE